jgi:hypothetical protein
MKYGQESWCKLSMAVISMLCVSLAALADPSKEDVSRVLAKARVLSHSFQVQCTPAHCHVVTYRNLKESEKDIKIDALLTTKVIRSAYPSIESVTVQFYETDLKTYQYIEVHAGDVRAFELGGVSKDQLLSSLPVHVSAAGGGTAAGGTAGGGAVPRQVVENYVVASGYGKPARTRMLADLQEIAAKGGDLSQIWPRFKAIEKVISEGGAEAIDNDFNKLVPDVAQALSSARVESSRIADQALQRNKQIESQNQNGKLAQHVRPGFGYLRRLRLAGEIERKAQYGNNVQYFQSLLFDTIEPLCRNGDTSQASLQMAQLEQQLGLSPYTGPL